MAAVAHQNNFMRISSKTLIKCVAVIVTAFQGFALFKGQEFSPMAYAGAITALFGGNSAHENINKYLGHGGDKQ